MSFFRLRQRKTRDVHGLAPILGILFAVGAITGFSELEHQIAEDRAVAAARMQANVFRLGAMPTSSTVTSSDARSAEHCNHPHVDVTPDTDDRQV